MAGGRHDLPFLNEHITRQAECLMVSEPHAFARRLRQSATKFEDVLWQRLRGSRLHEGEV